MTAPSVNAKLALLRENVELLGRIPQGTERAFTASFLNVQSALHLLQVAIQVLIDLAGYAVARHGVGPAASSLGMIEALARAGHLPPDAVERFRPVVGFRNRVVHLYDRIDASIVYRVLRERRLELLELGELLLDALPEDA